MRGPASAPLSGSQKQPSDQDDDQEKENSDDGGDDSLKWATGGCGCNRSR